MNLLPHLVTLVIGMAIGTIYGSWTNDEWRKELNKDEHTNN